ncbi:MAG: hypothetical protein ATN35_04210 [Epulopiscium sp. Nele67-Bin004]|nr:MAG: hypothetical protein ATN35_04210 [Epulopiscium sp. Nele67-Bin004]
MFAQRIEKAQQEERELQGKDRIIVAIRLFLAVAIAFLIYRGVTEELGLYVWLIGGAVAVFIVIVVIHSKLRKDIALLRLYQEVNKDYIRRQTDEWHVFEDSGTDLADSLHPYAYDLDIVGEFSLFKKINVAHTYLGRKKLGTFLLQADKSTINQRQQAVEDLLKRLDFVQKLQVIFRSNKGVADNPAKWASPEKVEMPSSLNAVAIVMPIVNIATLVGGYITSNSTLMLVGLICVGVCLSARMLLLAHISHQLEVLRTISYQVEPYIKAFKLIEDEQFESEYLSNKCKSIIGGDGGILLSLQRLEKIASFATISQQPMLALPLNGLLMWDFWVMKFCIDWQSEYGTTVGKALDLIAEFEALSSLATLGFVEGANIFGEVHHQKVLQGSELAHPLIMKEKRVANTFKMDDEIFIITGSNMSGKTTFLRTIGINLVMMYAGAPICGKSFKGCIVDIHTSMRTSDSLGQHTSTFHAEINRIKLLLDATKSGATILFLIDEIFRGTNSRDRISGAKGIITTLKQGGAIGALTTHDLEMCVLGEQQGIINYHFTDFFDNKQMYFDYKIKDGVATKTNAKYLMEMIGIEVIE